MGQTKATPDGGFVGTANEPPSGLGRHRKDANVTVYLQEELGDARLRCDQLLRYIERAAKLVEKSSHKDHFFEVAGDLIRGIPESAFKLHKALEAVALAANRIDYEEIKQDLRPEKVEELERVLTDVRVRQVQRRSLPMVNPANVVRQLKSLAKRAKEEGALDTGALRELIASLEKGAPRAAAGVRVAAALEAMAHALEHPPEGQMPSRNRLAQALRRTLAEHIELGREASEEAKRSRFEEGKPADPTKNMDPEDAKAWKENTDEYGDKFKKEAARPSEAALLDLNTVVFGVKQIIRGTGNTKRVLFSVLSSLSRAAANMGQDERILEALDRAARIVNSTFSVADMREYADSQEVVLASEEDKRSRFEEGKPADPTKNMDPEDAKAWKENTEEYGDKFKKEASVEGNIPLLERLVTTVTEAARQLKYSVDLVKRDYERYRGQEDNIRQEITSLESVLRVVQRRVFDVKTAADKVAGGQLIPAPPPDVVDEIMAWHGGQGSKLYSVGSRWFAGQKVDADDAEEVYDELERRGADHHALSELEDHLMQHGVTPSSVRERVDEMQKRELKEMEALLKKSGFDPKDAKKLQGDGMGPEELKTRLRHRPGEMGSLEYTHNLKRKTKRANDDAALWKAE